LSQSWGPNSSTAWAQFLLFNPLQGNDTLQSNSKLLFSGNFYFDDNFSIGRLAVPYFIPTANFKKFCTAELLRTAQATAWFSNIQSTYLEDP